MKRIALLFALSALCIGSAVHAQRNVYFFEDFNVLPGGTHNIKTYWDADSCVRIGNFLGIAGKNQSGGEQPEAIIGYYPKYGLEAEMNGTYKLVSKPFTTQAGTPYLTMKYLYLADRASAKENRSLSILVKKGTDAWVTCKTLDALPKEIPASVLSVKLPDEFANAENVRVAIQITGIKEESNDIQFYFTIDDVAFFSIPADWYSVKLNTTMPNSTGKLEPINLRLSNEGNEIKSNYTISYNWDNDQVYTETFTASKPIVTDSFTNVKIAPKGWNETAYGTHMFNVWVSAVDGKDLPEGDLRKQAFKICNVKESDLFHKKVLVEEFTSSTCPNCAGANVRVLDPVFNTLGLDIVLIKYQMNSPGKGDPYYTEEGVARCNFYGFTGIPSAAVNGTAVRLTNSSADFLNYMQTQMAKSEKSFFNIVFDTLAMNEATGELRVVYSIHTKGSLNAARVQTVVMEGVTTKNASTNGEKEFHHVVMAMVPGKEDYDKTGLEINLKTDTVYTFAYTVDMKKTHMEEADDLLAAVFIQAPDKSIVQATIKREQSKAANEDVLMSEPLSFYPNPAGEEVYLKALNNASVEVCDISGRRLYYATGISGDYTLDVRGYKTGFYLIKVREGNRVSVGRLNVVR